MLKCMLRAKIHQATVTDSNILYEGSLSVDQDLLDATGMKPFEQVRNCGKVSGTLHSAVGLGTFFCF